MSTSASKTAHSPSPLTFYTDTLTRQLYSSDASLYQELPSAVTFPKSPEDLIQLLDQARSKNLSVTMRAAGTSLAGQTTGDGIVADISRHMHHILDIDADNRTARVQPGVIRDQLNREAGKHGLLFGPDTSTTDRCMLGGMIANNSCGSYSIKYGTTREHVIELDVILSDGSRATFKPLDEDKLHQKMESDTFEGKIYREMISLLKDNRDLILEKYPHPEVKRRNTGYALDKLCEMHPITPGGRPFNMCEMLCGSEGTLALFNEAVVRLEKLEKHKLLLIPQFESLHEALRSTVEAVAFDPAAVELVDQFILDATKGNVEQNRNRFFLEGDPKALLIIEFQGDDMDELRDRANSLKDRLKEKKHGYAHSIMEQPDEQARVWNLRKAGLGLLMGYLSDSKSPEFVDDTAVRVEDLPDYIADFQKILKKHDTESVYYAHASVGELHLRPILNVKTQEGIDKMKAIAEEVADLVAKYRGSLSGEHGDGRLRSHLIEHMVGPEIMQLLRRVKTLWDPDNLLNRGKIIDPEPMDTDLRYSPEYPEIKVDTVFKWRAENGFGEALELCNGAGVCRKKAESGGTMCPSYMATLEEKDSTRGRANVFRQIFSNRQQDGFTAQEIKDALDLCLSCKACKTECPANVDMAKMKAEFTHGWHQKNGTSLSSQFFGNAALLYPLAGTFAPLVNYINSLAPVKGIYQYLLNVHPERKLPDFASQTFMSWYKKFRRSNKMRPADENTKKVVLVVDWFTDYHEPSVAKAALLVLERLGCHVHVVGPLESGRTHLSRGILDKAKTIAQTNIKKMKPYVDSDFRLVGLEPSEILTFRDEFLDLCDDDQLEDARNVAAASFMFEEFLTDEIDEDRFSDCFNGVGQQVHVHGHCHSKALVGNSPVLEALKRANYLPVEMKTGCCGMAGSFGYEEKNYKVSMDIGELTLFPQIRKINDNGIICSHGFSCRHQISDGTGRESRHTSEIVWDSRK
ncbi:FAD-binding and (Fe-S)-binding domain-containing protein [Natronogracilivirga saccharolytica]|uniref:FAD-binding and (Fe-S)-binding domain-containing protein n=1 Tax=Natronogracilivirga saccharolytica TaxID=2812953 RepID=UPI001FE74C15|nr:FAD-binding and (Fe-S)-binding domain-containing protein [Natronogracilivirga saccharolytica]